MARPPIIVQIPSPESWMSFFSSLTKILLPATVAVAAISVGCSESEGIPCDTDGDCFQTEACSDGYCVLLEGSNSRNDEDGSNDQDGGDNQNQNNGGSQSCEYGFPCSSGIDSLDEGDGYHLRPGGDEELIFGCDHQGFHSEEVVVSEVHSCSGTTHHFLTPILECDDREFSVEVELIPLDEACPIDEFGDVEFEYVEPMVECGDSQTHDYCYHVDRPEHGGYRWTAEVPSVSSSTSNYEFPAEFWLTPDEGASFRYEVRARAYDGTM